MLAESSAEKSHRLPPSFDLRPRQRVAMVSMAYVPLLHVLMCLLVVAPVFGNFLTRLGICRRCGRIVPDSPVGSGDRSAACSSSRWPLWRRHA